ncbi:MAG TPA: hypothetical protein VKG25_21515 [Bryobacteraceae bacterium]|nr:hypothetical protein [Bryobacteraceae bacterium]
MYRLKRAAMLATLAVAALALTATAQTKTNFAGSWKLNVGKSDFGPLPPPDSETHTVIQTDAGLRDAVIADTQQGKQDYTITYNFDGSETVNTPGGLEIKSKAKWDGPALTVTSKLKFQDQDVDVKDVWTLSADGKILTKDTHFSSSMGEADQKIIYEKATGDVSAAVVVPAASAASGSKPNYSGTWKLNTAKSDFGPLPPPDSETDVIDHKEPTVVINVDAATAQGPQKYTLNTTTDNVESAVKMGPRDAKVKTTWEAGNISSTVKLTFNDQDVSMKRVYVLSPDGKTLTVNNHLESPMGEADQKLIYEKVN